MEISQRDARKLFLQQQGLLRNDTFGRGRSALEQMLRRLSYLQIDTISVVDRAHEHIAATRISNFQADDLNHLVRERKVFEYWSHAASFLPFDNYRYALPVMKGWRSTRNHDSKLAAMIVDRIRAEGPLQSRDFEDSRQQQTSGWWEWKPAKKALEHLFLAGELMITERVGFQKVFDLPERVIPDHVNTTEPSSAEWADTIVRSQVDALGIATAADIGYARATIRRLSGVNLKVPLQDSIDRQLAAGDLLRVRVDNREYYSTPALLEGLPGRVSRHTVRLLSPFDNLVINRRRALELFNFDYQLECYVPAAKRQYGYFALPLLYGDELIGRMDTKADRKAGTLLIRNLVLEDQVKTDAQLIRALATGIADFARRHQTPDVKMARCEPASLKGTLMKRLNPASG